MPLGFQIRGHNLPPWLEKGKLNSQIPPTNAIKARLGK